MRNTDAQQSIDSLNRALASAEWTGGIISLSGSKSTERANVAARKLAIVDARATRTEVR